MPSAVTTPAGGRSTLTYESGFITSATDATGTTTLTSRDSLGNPTRRGPTVDELWTYEFDAEGNLTNTRSPSGRTWESVYGPRGMLQREADPLGRTVSYAYDTSGNLVRTTSTDRSTAQRAYDGSGRLSSTTEPDGLITRYEYDADGRVHTIVTPGDRAWRVGYEDKPDGSLMITTVGPDGTATVTGLDSAGREVLRQFLDVDGRPVETVTMVYEYDLLLKSTIQRGPSRLVTLTSHDIGGNVVGVLSALDDQFIRNETYEYENGRIVATRLTAGRPPTPMTLPDGSSRSCPETTSGQPSTTTAGSSHASQRRHE